MVSRGSAAAPPVGRERELSFLTERLEVAGRGEGGVVFIGGELGIGKSRILVELSGRAAHEGWLVLSGRSYDTPGLPAYLPFVDAMREYARLASDDALHEILQASPAAASLIPEIHTRLPEVPKEQPLNLEAERSRLFVSVSDFFLRAASSFEFRGLLLCLDDLQWADRSTLLLLLHLARKLPAARVLILAAYRTDESGKTGPLFSVMADMARERFDQRVALRRLSRDETGALVESLSETRPTPAVVEAIQQQTQGNPFFVEEVVRQLRSEGRRLDDPEVAGHGWPTPEGVREVIGRRVSGLSIEGQRLLQASAVLSDRVSPNVVKAMLGLADEALVGGFEELGGAGMLREDGSAYDFAHPFIREVVYDALSLVRRQQLHTRAAEVLEARKGPESDSRFGTIGHHWRLGGRPDHAVEYLLRAGDAAIALTAWEEGTRHWEAALDCMKHTGQPPGRCARLLEGLGDLYFLSSFEAHPAVERYEEASALYKTSGDLVSAARAQARAGRSLAYPTSGYDYAGALKHLRAAEAVLSADLEGVELGELYAAIAHAESHALQNGPDEMLEAMRHVGEIAEKMDNEFLRDCLRVQSHHLQGHYLGLQGHLGEGLAREEQACDMAWALREKGGLVNQWPEKWNEYLLAYSRDDQPLAANETGSLQFWGATSRAGLANFTTNCCGWQSIDLNDPLRARMMHERIRDAQGRFMTPFLPYDLFLCGDIAALRRLAEAGTSAISTINPDALITCRTLLSWAEGQLDEVESIYAERASRYREQGSNTLVSWNNRTLIRVSRMKRDLKAAESLTRQSLAISLSSGAVKYEFISRAELALLLAEMGSIVESEENLSRCRDILAAGEDWRGLAGRAALAEAVLAAAHGRHVEAQTQFERALGIFRTLSLPWDEAEAFEIWARACARFYRGRGRRSFIGEKLASASAIYERIGAGQPWLERLEVEEKQLAGRNSNELAPGLPDHITQREADVLRLIAAGKSNREVADELVLSVRTVERHITNIYTKIGAHGKADATAYALRHSLI